MNGHRSLRGRGVGGGRANVNPGGEALQTSRDENSRANFSATRLPPNEMQRPYQHPPVDPSVTESRKILDTCHQMLNELRRGLDEQRKVRDDVRRNGQMVVKVEESVKELREVLKDHTEQSFTIESSSYKDGLLKEVSRLFTTSLKRLPSRDEIGRSIIGVLQDAGRNKQKFNKAKTFCSNRLTSLRCEERRRLFGNKPCKDFLKMRTSEFAEKFMAGIKAPDECRRAYMKHLALLRKFKRECTGAQNDTFKKFREWLDNNYASGCPSGEEWEVIIREDEGYDYSTSIGNEREGLGDLGSSESDCQYGYEPYPLANEEC